jgi:hypothetical protein
VHDIHIRLSKKTHERLVAHLVRHPKATNKSQLARLILEDGLGISSEPDPRLRFEPILLRIDALDQRLAAIDDRTRFAELALTEVLGRRPGLAEDVRRRAQEASDRSRPRNATPKGQVKERPPIRAEQHATEPPPDPKKMTPSERAAWKERLMRELTGQD